MHVILSMFLLSLKSLLKSQELKMVEIGNTMKKLTLQKQCGKFFPAVA